MNLEQINKEEQEERDIVIAAYLQKQIPDKHRDIFINLLDMQKYDKIEKMCIERNKQIDELDEP